MRFSASPRRALRRGDSGGRDRRCREARAFDDRRIRRLDRLTCCRGSASLRRVTAGYLARGCAQHVGRGADGRSAGQALRQRAAGRARWLGERCQPPSASSRSSARCSPTHRGRRSARCRCRSENARGSSSPSSPSGATSTQTTASRRDDEVSASAGRRSSRADLFDAAERARDRARRLQAVTAAFSAAATPAQVGEVIADAGLRATDAEAALAYVPGRRRWPSSRCQAGHAEEVIAEWETIPSSADVPVWHVLRSGETLVFESSEDAQRRFPGPCGNADRRARGGRAIIAQFRVGRRRGRALRDVRRPARDRSR